MAISFFISSTFTITRGVISISIMTDLRINMIIINDCYYTRSPSQDFRIFGPRPWKILATTYERNGFLSNPDPGENLVSGNLVMETGCISYVLLLLVRVVICRQRMLVCYRPRSTEIGSPAQGIL